MGRGCGGGGIFFFFVIETNETVKIYKENSKMYVKQNETNETDQ